MCRWHCSCLQSGRGESMRPYSVLWYPVVALSGTSHPLSFQITGKTDSNNQEESKEETRRKRESKAETRIGHVFNLEIHQFSMSWICTLIEEYALVIDLGLCGSDNKYK